MKSEADVLQQTSRNRLLGPRDHDVEKSVAPTVHSAFEFGLCKRHKGDVSS